MKKILYLTANLDFTPDNGARIKTLQTLSALSKKFTVRVLSLNSQKLQAKPNIPELQFESVIDPTIEIPVKNRLRELVQNYLTLNPYYFFQYQNPLFQKRVTELLQTFSPDIIHIDHLTMAQYLPKEKRQFWIYEAHNLEARLRWQMAVISRKFGYHWLIWFMEAMLIYFREKTLLKKFDHIFAISERDRQLLNQLIGRNNITVQPIVIIPQRVRRQRHDGFTLFFVGDLEWLPNTDAIQWFLRTVFPLVQKQIPAAKIIIAGRKPPREVSLPKGKNISFTGYQTSLQKFWQQADVFIAPFRIAEGIRLKILSALSYQIPIVATPAAARGFNSSPSFPLLTAESASLFAQKISDLSHSASLRKKLRGRSVKYLEKHHGVKLTAEFLRNYTKITNARFS